MKMEKCQFSLFNSDCALPPSRPSSDVDETVGESDENKLMALRSRSYDGTSFPSKVRSRRMWHRHVDLDNKERGVCVYINIHNNNDRQ